MRLSKKMRFVEIDFWIDFTEYLELITEYWFQFPPPQLSSVHAEIRRGEKASRSERVGSLLFWKVKLFGKKFRHTDSQGESFAGFNFRN